MENKSSYKHCLNCQTELHGNYCHVCGQHATNAKPTVKEFIIEYLNIAFIWDTQFFKTIWQIIRKPGHVTKEYVSGKFVSYTHPLKLNMFLLFVFLTIFLFFHKDFDNSIQSITRDDANYSLIQIQSLLKDKKYEGLLMTSPRDTVQLYAPLHLGDHFPDVITFTEASSSIPRDSVSVWTAVVPNILIEIEVIVPDDEGHYYFNQEDKTGVVGTKYIEKTWKEMVRLVTTYFPIVILLTVPFLALLLCLSQFRGGHTKFKHFIFSLHYTAFLEILILLLYFIHLIAGPPTWLMQSIMILGSCVYLTLAIRKVYETEKWYKAAGQAIFVNLGYAAIFMLLLFIIFIISIVAVAINM